MNNPLIATITPWVRQLNAGKSLILTEEEIQSAIHSTLGFYHGLLLNNKEANPRAFFRIQQNGAGCVVRDIH